MDTELRISHIEKQIIGLEKDADGMRRVTDKLDQTLDVMRDTTASIREMLAVHDSKIRSQHETSLDIYRALDEIRSDSQNRFKEVSEEITKCCGQVSSKLEEVEGDLLEKLGKVDEQVKDQDRRIRGLERITFIGLGIAMLIGWLADKIPFDRIF